MNSQRSTLPGNILFLKRIIFHLDAIIYNKSFHMSEIIDFRNSDLTCNDVYTYIIY